MAIPYETETVAATTAVNPAAGAIVQTGFTLASLLGLGKGKTTHIDWNKANQYAVASVNTVFPFLKSRFNSNEISQAYAGIIAAFKRERERYWLNTRNWDIDKDIERLSSASDKTAALGQLLWLLFIWVNTSIPADGTGYNDHTRTLFSLIILKPFEQSGMIAKATDVANAVKFEPLWSVSVNGSPQTTATGKPVSSSPLAAGFDFGSSGNVLIGLGLFGAVVYFIMKGNKP